MAIKGLKDLHYAVILSENENETVYGPVKPLGPAASYNRQPTINRANMRLDDRVYFSDTAKGPITITLNVGFLTKEVQADILGKKIHQNGLISDNATDQAPYIAIGGTCESARGGYEYFWDYRVKFAPAEEAAETKAETPTYQGTNLAGEGLPRLNDGEEKTKVWDGDKDIAAVVFENWFKEVIDKDYIATV